MPVNKLGNGLNRIPNLSNVNQPPAYNLVNMDLDGSIVDVSGSKYFVNKKGENILITNYDFPTGWTKGFPYKSAATIDVFGFTGVPVTSLFQNIDYAGQFFNFHEAQILVDGVEIYQPRVSRIVAYSAPLTGADLIKANTWFLTPVEITANVKWVDVNFAGTALGTKAAPYKSLPAATTGLTAGDTVYVKSGEYDLTAATWNNSAKLSNFIGIGFTRIKCTTAANRTYYPNAGIFEGFYFNGTGTSYAVMSITSGLKVDLRRCYIDGKNSMINPLYDATPATSFELKNCIFKDYTGFLQNILAAAFKLDTCKVSGLIAQPALAINADGINVSILNSNFTHKNIVSLYAAGKTLGNVIIKGSKVVCDDYFLNVFDFASLTALSSDLTFKTLYTLSDTTPNVNLVSVQNCKITSNTTVTPFQITNKNLVFANNNFALTSTDRPFIIQKSTGDSLNTSIHDNNLNTTGHGSPIVIGDEFFVIKDKVNGSIYNNKIKGVPAVGGDHGVCVWANKGIAIHHNRVDGWVFAVVQKGGNCDYATNPVYNNIFINGYVINKGVSNCAVYGNVLIRTDSANVSLSLLDDESANHSLNNQFKNNIVINSFAGNAIGLIDLEAGATITSDYNIFFNINQEAARIGGLDKTMAEWQALGYDAHSIMLPSLASAKALFVDYDNGNYALAAGSAAIGAGITLGAAYDDGLDASTNWGTDTQLPVVVTKQQGAGWDIGAYMH